jgi:hypothetical protein
MNPKGFKIIMKGKMRQTIVIMIDTWTSTGNFSAFLSGFEGEKLMDRALESKV